MLVATVVAAVCLRARHAGPDRPTRPPPVVFGGPAPSGPAREARPVAIDLPADARVAAAGPFMLHGDPAHSHRAHGLVGRTPNVAWSFQADGPIEAQVVVSPDEATLYVATLGGTLWALERSGRPRYSVPLGARAYATPCVAPDGTLYVGTDGGAFYALSPEGRILWKLETAGDADTGCARLDGGVVVFAAGTDVYGVTPEGSVAFRFRAKGKVFTAPAWTTRAASGRDGVRILVGAQDHRVYALDDQGGLDWATDLGHDVDGAATLGDNGEIFVGTDGDEVVRLGGDGHIAWRLGVGGHVRGALSISRNGDVLAGVYGPSPRLVRIASDGALRGAVPTRGNGTREVGVMGGPLEDDAGTLVFGGQDGVVRVVDRDGSLRWAHDLHADVDAPVILLPDGTLVVADYAGRVTALSDPLAEDARGAR